MPRRSAWHTAFLDTLRRTANVTLAARAVGITTQAAHKAHRTNAEFREKWDWAMEEAIDLLEAEMRRRATQGVEVGVYYKGERIDTQRKYSDQLIMFLAKAHRPEKYRDNVAVEHSGQVDSPDLQEQIKALTPEGRKLLGEVLSDLTPAAAPAE